MQRRKVTSPEPYGVKVEIVKALCDECRIRRVPGDEEYLTS